MSIIIPPIKSQGIKSKLVPWISELVMRSGVSDTASWIEPFFGTGVVGLNSSLRGSHIVGDTNPHIIDFYKGLQSGEITAHSVRQYLEAEGKALREAEENGYSHFRSIRDRFNKEHSPYDFLFLSRSGFNGLMRFNKQGAWNVPFCKKSNRFSPAYITKICNQVGRVVQVVRSRDWVFRNQSFIETIREATPDDLIYCDPPYFGRYVDYYNGWTEEDEYALYESLKATKAKFILSTWHHNHFRKNEMIDLLWKDFAIQTQEHFYHSGAKIENRHAMVEALIYNFDLQAPPPRKDVVAPLTLFPEVDYSL